ncbi:CubicO group peptidase (beta-lactamase class C family) [Balneicella halophila]|uniref:Beta-lactamase n=1 Tax=Balneicella halophila TaxID=1537566 RepID=A0A7L4UNI3_BALHA|nr:serine hydrolase [Balneicella halophila]PVX50116.1 CubicO group peptidase (beta-lactamase class C family) [Balneicella halophila]
MKNIILIVLTLIVNVSFGQTEKADNKIITEKFVEHYNNDNYNGIFSMFADVMKEALPIDRTTEFLKSLKSQAGNITNREFIKYLPGNLASYKTTFERAVFALNIAINDNSKIIGLSVQPLAEEVNIENVINDLSIKNGSITKCQSEIIFEGTYVFPNNTQLSIAIINNENVSYYGIKKESDTISTIDNQKSVFEIGSISKVFTSTLLANFVIDGKIKLNENINDYLKTPFNNDTKISFINLANHTSGLPRLPTNLDLSKVNPENPYKEYKEKELEEYVTNQLELPNKGKYQYSNLGAGLLGYTLSNIENTSYESLLQNKIFSKYDMKNSTADINKIKGNLVRGLNNEGVEIPNWDLSVLAGAGGILSTTDDLSKFVIAQFNTSNKALELTRQKTFEINEKMDIGLGWHILKSKSENLWYWHNGGTGGYSSSMVIDENSKNGIIILSNVSAFNPNMGNIDKLCFELMKTLEKE